MFGPCFARIGLCVVLVVFCLDLGGASVEAQFGGGRSVEIEDDESPEASSPGVVRGARPAGPGGPNGAGKPAGTANPADERKARRLQMIRGLSFDRRPSAILKAWKESPPNDLPADAGHPAATATSGATTSNTSKPNVARGDAAKPDASKPNAAKPIAEKPAAAPGDDVAIAELPAAVVAAEQAAKQAVEAKKKAAEDSAFQHELTALQRHVTLGEWPKVREFCERLDLEESKALWQQMLTTLQAGAVGRMNVEPSVLQQLVNDGADLVKIQQTLSSMGQGPGAAYVEKNLFTMPDLLGLMLASPAEYDDGAVQKLGQILMFSIHAGFDLEHLLSQPSIVAARAGTRVVVVEDPPAKKSDETSKAADGKQTGQKPNEAAKDDAKPSDAAATTASITRKSHAPTARDIARLLVAARQELRAGDYLPTAAEAVAAKDGAGLNLISRHALAKYAKDSKTTALEDAWQATQSVLELGLPPEPPPETKTAETKSAETTGANAATEGVAPGAVRLPPGVRLPAGVVLPSPSGSPSPGPMGAVAAVVDPARETAVKRFQSARAARDEALTRAVELAPKVRKELGQTWLTECFQKRLERGKEILTAIGAATTTSLASHPQDNEFRKRGLSLQKTAVDALLPVAAKEPAAWQEPLTVVAVAWLKEAQVSHQLDDSAAQRGWRRDRYGNFFMFDDEGYMPMQRFGRGSVSPIKIEDVLELKPNSDWLNLVSADMRPKFTELLAQLHLKMQDEKAAFPHIERLAATHPARAKDLAEEFLKVWTSSHNPNERRDGYNPFYYYWSYERRAERIPLTRSKQERNLVELADLVKRLRALPIGELNETLLTNAFTTSHSKAEVYRLEAIESVFGSVDALKPRTLAELIQQMRGNLAGVWRMPDVQRQNSTNRKQRDIRAEVIHGYEAARKVTKNALERHPNHWALLLAQAAVMHDEIDYEKEAEKSSDFSARRADVLKLFGDAAKAYVEAVAEIPLDEQTVLPFEMWFYAALGSVDLARITADKIPDLTQPPLIRAALTSLPGETAERHLSQFANNLFTRATDAKPELKHRYLRAGFEVVGEHKLAREARKLLEYYADLVTEIKLETKIDGSDVVGHQKPFGVFVNLVHTKEIERESGGFGKYLQNQNNSTMYFYNFGRPLENYRDKFRDYAQKAVGEHFEVVSVTFQEASVNSRALPEYGWRTTPYAYLLLKAKGPEVDKLPPLRMDLDFLDTSGFALLPIESPALPLDAKSDAPPARPAADIVVTQTLDERQADKGKLLLEIRATARGLAPDLNELLDLNPPGFQIDKTEDRSLAVQEFDKEAPENVVKSERQWTVTLVAADAGKRPESFRFGAAKLPVKEMIHQRYEDADLKEVEAEISLVAQYGKTSWKMPALAAAAGVAPLAAAFGLWRVLRSAPPPAPSRFVLPDAVTPFTVIGFLQTLETEAGFDDATRGELARAVESIERHYFHTPNGSPPDLDRIARDWLQNAARG